MNISKQLSITGLFTTRPAGQMRPATLSEEISKHIVIKDGSKIFPRWGRFIIINKNKPKLLAPSPLAMRSTVIINILISVLKVRLKIN